MTIYIPVSKIRGRIGYLERLLEKADLVIITRYGKPYAEAVKPRVQVLDDRDPKPVQTLSGHQ